MDKFICDRSINELITSRDDLFNYIKQVLIAQGFYEFGFANRMVNRAWKKKSNNELKEIEKILTESGVRSEEIEYICSCDCLFPKSHIIAIMNVILESEEFQNELKLVERKDSNG